MGITDIDMNTVQNFVGECPASTEMLVRSAM
jgi:hypothetical protein